jgi:2-methylcitrate dehydratase PrpD
MVAAGAARRRPRRAPEDFTDAARDPRRLALAALVRCVEEERCNASFPHAFPAVLRVTTRTGEELEARVEVNHGGPGNPLSDEELARISTTTP